MEGNEGSVPVLQLPERRRDSLSLLSRIFTASSPFPAKYAQAAALLF